MKIIKTSEEMVEMVQKRITVLRSHLDAMPPSKRIMRERYAARIEELERFLYRVTDD